MTGPSRAGGAAPRRSRRVAPHRALLPRAVRLRRPERRRRRFPEARVRRQRRRVRRRRVADGGHLRAQVPGAVVRTVARAVPARAARRRHVHDRRADAAGRLRDAARQLVALPRRARLPDPRTAADSPRRRVRRQDGGAGAVRGRVHRPDGRVAAAAVPADDQKPVGRARVRRCGWWRGWRPARPPPRSPSWRSPPASGCWACCGPAPGCRESPPRSRASRSA